jgi:hypothetical protein
MGASSSIISADHNFYGVITGDVVTSRSVRMKVVQRQSERIVQEVQFLISSTLRNMQAKEDEKNTAKRQLSAALSVNSLFEPERFLDSMYFPKWLPAEQADELFTYLAKIGELNRPSHIENECKIKSKYPLWSKYYSFRRSLDGAMALDRWGSYHEGWIRTEEPPELLQHVASCLRKEFRISDDSINSILVNYYYHGEHTYIPAHRDTTAWLEEGSHIICLSLGASRDFVLCDNADVGKFEKENMNISKEWRVNHGDIFAIGQQTNQLYCHAVPQESNNQKLRISIVFRSVDKSFIDYSCSEKVAYYHDLQEKPFKAEIITTNNYNDHGTREHLADLITRREEKRKNKFNREKEKYEIELSAQNLGTQQVIDSQSKNILESYYLGQGSTVH